MFTQLKTHSLSLFVPLGMIVFLQQRAPLVNRYQHSGSSYHMPSHPVFTELRDLCMGEVIYYLTSEQTRWPGVLSLMSLCHTIEECGALVFVSWFALVLFAYFPKLKCCLLFYLMLHWNMQLHFYHSLLLIPTSV